VAFWIIALICAVPIAPMVMDVVDYNMSTGGLGEVPSAVAQRYINENFAGSTVQAGGSMILLQTGDQQIYSQGVKNDIMNITAHLLQAKADGRIKDNISVVSIYTELRDYTAVYIYQVGPYYSAGANYSYAIPMFLFDVPLSYWESYNTTEETLWMEYAMPELYLLNWISSNGTGGTVDEINGRAYAQTRSEVEFILDHRPGMNETEKSLVRLYLADFTSAWNTSSANPTYWNDPTLHMNHANELGFLNFRNEPLVRAQGPLFELYITVVHDNFDTSNYHDFHRISYFNDVIYRGILEITLSLLPQELRDDCLLYYGTFYHDWNASGDVPTVAQFRGYADHAANVTAAVAGPPVDQLIDIYYYQLGWENRTNRAEIDRLTINFLASYTQTQPWLVQTIINMGDNPNATDVLVLANKIVQNSTVPQYPLPVMPLIPILLVSENNDSTLMMVTFTQNGKYVTGTGYVSLIRQIVSTEVAKDPSMKEYVTGLDPMTYDSMVSMDQALQIIDPVAILLILILIGLYFNSVLAAALPPAVIGIGLGISFALLYFVAAFIFDVNYFVVTLMITATLGAGCDYCIFMLSRYREERRNGKEKQEAVEEAVTWAGETVTTSGITVMIGFGAMFVASMDLIKSFGTLVIGIVLALLISLTLIPAILSLLGDKVFWPSKKIKAQSKIAQNYFKHAAESSIKHAKVFLVAAIVISVPAIYIVATSPTSYDFIQTMPPCESKAGMEAMESSFGAGMVQPTQVAMSLAVPIYNTNGDLDIGVMNAVENMSQQLMAVGGISKLFGPTRPYGYPIDYQNLSKQYTVAAAQELATISTMVGKNNESVMVTLIFQEDPFSQQAMDSILTIRDIAAHVDQYEPLITAAYVGGGTAGMYDLGTTTTHDFVMIIAVAIILVYIVLMIVLGSVLNPLRSILTILLSISWTIAITSLAFEYGMGMALNFEVPLILTVVCLGLGMDYDVLLSTRIREEVHKGMDTNEAIKHSMLQTGGIITVCGVVMASAFGSLMLTGNPMLMMFGMALMVAILLDATVVRTYLVPAIMSLLGKWNWWAPKALQRKGIKEDKEK
jgi:RND superfamily putative drug exporter